jgi:hypothetical protein
MFSSLPSDDWPRADLLRCCSVFMTRLTLRIACSFLVSGKQFDPLKLFIICRQEAVLRSGLTQLWQLFRDGRNHAGNPAGTREHFEAAGDSRWCVQPELGSAPTAWGRQIARVEKSRREARLAPFLVDCPPAFAGGRSKIGRGWLLASLSLQINLHFRSVTPQPMAHSGRQSFCSPGSKSLASCFLLEQRSKVKSKPQLPKSH